MSWGISPDAPEHEKIFAKFADNIYAMNTCCKIDYGTYSELFDIGKEMFEKVYEQGKCDAVKSDSDKYRWHDLRKDPEDLPTEEKYYDCALEDHEEDLCGYPSFMYDLEYGFGVWQTKFHPVTLGVIDDEFLTMEDLGYSKVVVWREICLFENEE